MEAAIPLHPIGRAASHVNRGRHEWCAKSCSCAALRLEEDAQWSYYPDPSSRTSPSTSNAARCSSVSRRPGARETSTSVRVRASTSPKRRGWKETDRAGNGSGCTEGRRTAGGAGGGGGALQESASERDFSLGGEGERRMVGAKKGDGDDEDDDEDEGVGGGDDFLNEKNDFFPVRVGATACP